MSQDLLFELDDIRVTRHVAYFGETSYQIANIGRVRIARRTKANRLAVFMLLAGAALVILGAFERKYDVAVAGLAVIGAGAVVQLFWPRRQFILVLKTSSGDIAAFVSRKQDLVARVKAAIESAFAARG